MVVVGVIVTASLIVRMVMLESFWVLALVVLAAHHGECCGGYGSAEASFCQMHHLVIFAGSLFEELVGCKGCGGYSDNKVNVFAKVDFLSEVLDEVSRGVWAMGIMVISRVFDVAHGCVILFGIQFKYK